MKIVSITVKNFRLLKNLTVKVEDSLSIIIGRNNTGKTSLLKVMNAFISGTGKDFQFEDFSLDVQTAIIAFESQSVKAEDYSFDSISLELVIEYNQMDDISRAAPLILDLDDKSSRLKLRFELGLNYNDYCSIMRDFAESKTESNSSDSFSDFVRDNFHRYFKKSIFAVDPNDPSGNKRRKLDNTFSIKQIVSMSVISARRDVNNDGHSHTLSNLASQHYEAQDSQDELDPAFVRLHRLIKDTDDKLTSQYGPIFKDIIEDIKNMSYSSKESRIKVESRLSEGSLFRDNTRVTYEQGKISLPEEYNGLGYMNLFSIVFSIHVQINQLKKNESLINLLFLEEPEAHAHPQMQYVFIEHIKDLLNKYKAEADLHLQTIMSSHSPQIVSLCDFNDIKYFRRTEDQTTSLNLSDLKTRMVTSNSPAENDKQDRAFRFVRQYITLDKAELFFSEKAILIEGDTERILMQAMMKKFDDQMRGLLDDSQVKKEYLSSGYLLSQDICVLEVGAYSQHFKELIDFLGIKTLIITDLDSVNAEGTSENPNLKTATKTKNTSLKAFFNTNKLQYFSELTPSQKILSSPDEGRTWRNHDNGLVRIAFQIPEGNYQPRSFEDAFFAQGDNMQFVACNKDSFEGLKYRDQITEGCTDFYEVGDKCILKKTTFALDLLLYDGIDDRTWQTPLYIDEGLRWLQQ